LNRIEQGYIDELDGKITEARRKISLAQKARWAKTHKAKAAKG